MIVTKAFIEEFCDSVSFPNNASLNSWCIRHEEINGVHILSKKFYNSIALDNSTRAMLHMLNGTLGFASHSEDDLFWKTINRLIDLSDYPVEEISDLLRKTGNNLSYPPPIVHAEFEDAVWHDDPNKLYGQIAQMVRFLGPLGPTKGHFTIPHGWHSFAAAYGAEDLIGGVDDRLQRSQRFGDKDYPSEVNSLLQSLSKRSLKDALAMSYALASDLDESLITNYPELRETAMKRTPLFFDFLSAQEATSQITDVRSQGIDEINQDKPNAEADQISKPKSAMVQEVSDEFVKVERGIGQVGDHFEYKTKITNKSSYVVTDVTITIVSFPKDCLEIVNDNVRGIQKIEPGRFRSPSFRFLPTKDCVEGDVISSVTYLDHKGVPHTLMTRPKIIRSVCDLLKPVECTIDAFVAQLKNLEEQESESKLDCNAKLIFRMLLEALPSRNFCIVQYHEETLADRFFGTINCLAEGKYTSKKVSLVMSVTGPHDGNYSAVKIKVGGEDIAMLPTTIRELKSEIQHLRESIDILSQGMTHLMVAAGVSIAKQNETISLVEQALQRADCNSILVKDLTLVTRAKFEEIQSGQKSIEDVLMEIEQHVRYTAEKLLLDKSHTSRIVQAMKNAALAVTDEAVGSILWSVLKAALAVYLGMNLP